MELPAEMDDYMRESIEHSLGMLVSDNTLRLKLLASEDARRRLQGQVFVLEDRLRDADSRLEQSRAEAAMNAQGLRRCVEEKELLSSRCADLANQCTKLEKECVLYDKDIERLMESCDELGRENDDLRVRLKDAPNVATMTAEIESLQKDKEHLRINLHRAEEEVKALFEENGLLDEENKRILKLLSKEKHLKGSDRKQPASASATKHSGTASTKGKRKSCLKENSPTKRTIDFNGTDSCRQPLSPLQQNSPDARRHKK